MVYEAMLLFGVLFVADGLLDTLTQSRHTLALRDARQFWLFLVLGAYFVFFWHRGGQTLAMKTWKIRLIAPGYSQVSITRAMIRYLLAWMWFLPAMMIDYVLGLKGWSSIGVILAGMALWVITIYLSKNRQFLHDQLAGTQLVVCVASSAKVK